MTPSSRTSRGDRKSQARRWLRPALLAGIWVGATAAVLASGASDVAALRSDIATTGSAGPVLFAAIFALVTLAPLPKNALSAAAGLLFNFTTAIAAVWVGAVLGAAAAFWLSRTLGRDAVERLAGKDLRRADHLLAGRGLLGVLLARLVPVLPFTVINYGSGLAAIPFTSYLTATAVGILPGTVAYVTLGAYGTSAMSWPILAAVGVLATLTLAGGVIARRVRHRGASADLKHPAELRPDRNRP